VPALGVEPEGDEGSVGGAAPGGEGRRQRGGPLGRAGPRRARGVRRPGPGPYPPRLRGRTGQSDEPAPA
jgi:hypothetical protein